MSDSDSDFEFAMDWDDSRPILDARHVVALRPSEGVVDRWGSIPADVKQEAGQRMKICTFWLPILLQHDESNHTAAWALQIGLIDAKEREDISMKRLHRIEILEAILRALEKGSFKREPTKHVFWISNMFNLRSPEVLEDALLWLERTGEPAIRRRVLELGHINTCFIALHLIFTEFAKYIEEMGTNLDRTMRSLLARPDDYYIEKSEEMKMKGNENFQKSQYEDAVKFYSKAIKYYPDNHIIYGNRALCYIRCQKYLKAVGDGKRATLIKPLWAKGHYRYCEALFSLGEVKNAIEANISAQSLCRDDSEGIKDLEQQHVKFMAETAKPKVGRPKSKNKRPGSTNRDAVESRQQTEKSVKPAVVTNEAPQSKVSEVKTDKQPGRNEQPTQMKSSTTDSKPSISEMSSKNGKGDSNATAKTKSKNRSHQAADGKPKVADGKAGVCKELKTVVQDAYTALADTRSRNAENAFSQALAILETNTPKELGLSTLDVLLLLYGRASALTEIGQPEELAEALKLMEKMKSFEERTFQCLVCYATGGVYLKENRFAVALEQFSDSLQMVKNQITPGKLTWPLTKEIVKETQPDYFKEILESAIELCKFPPIPNAICRLDKCHGSLKAEIYFTDPDFKGFIQICCCQSCTVEYHITCWKSLKTSVFSEKNEKDILQEACLTPDCVGQIFSIKITGPTGLLKCKFEAAITKPQTLKKPKVNQKCTSLVKLKLKAENRLKRKQHKQSFQDNQTINDEILTLDDISAAPSEQKAWLLYRDRVLLQISQNMELLREQRDLQPLALTSSLQPWLELDSKRGNRLAERMLNWQQESLETFAQAVEVLLERKNRVWARVLIQLLSSSMDINPKLNKWACQLNDAGLNAAKTFIERYAGDLEQLDLALLLSFGPLQDVIITRLGTRPELLSSMGLTVTEYLKQAPPHDMRLFIWTLEEHRDEYLTCHPILDEYFDMMDGHCSVLKKSDETENNSPMKNKSRGRKKKLKEPRGAFVLSGRRSVTPRDDWDQDFYEDDSLSLLQTVDPFIVPSHLREQVADFEDQYDRTRHRSLSKRILDNHPDPAKESLYDYFAQILEEHGPLVAEDPLLVGELQFFPHVSQLKIQEAGGFESFLLESLRFIKMGRCIGLAKHAVCLQQAGHGASLDDLDDIVDPDTKHSAPDLPQPVFPRYQDKFSSAQTEGYPIFPNPYTLGFKSASGVPASVVKNPFFHWREDDGQQPSAYFFMNGSGDSNPQVTESDVRVLDMHLSSGGVASLTSEESTLKRHAAVQTCVEIMSNVAVNTELHERFENCQGDINRKEKSNKSLEQQIKEMSNGCDQVNQKHKADITSLEEEIRKITANIQVTNKELALFQQKLEEEVRKDQKEKKANQEVMKTIKLEIEELVEEQGSLARNIRDKKADYDAKLSDFLEQGNQSAAEKMSLEDEIKRSKAVVISATRRCHTAQLSVAESSRDQGLYSLYRELADAKAFLTKLEEAVHRFPNQDLEISRNTCRSNVQEIEKKISTAETQYQEQMDQVKNGRRVGEWLTSNISQSESPAQLRSAAAKDLTPQPSAQAPHSAAPLLQQSAAPPAAEALAAPPPLQHKPPSRTLEPPHNNMFERAMDRLAAIFPDYTRLDLKRFVQELRSSRGGRLSSMMLHDVVDGVTQLILDHQESLDSVRSNIAGRGSPAQCATPPSVNTAPAWQPVGYQRATHPNALNVEDPCIICHDDMSPEDTCVLECRHSFHKECIRSWLKEQSTCPTCRDHALMPEDFPVLPGRRRQAP
ncbi:E3 ubiquitin-protein ligase TTC3 [Scophthalmus maximus]|uniref:RING-type E3 ubiquitin transferase n=1 Tax=Scophthalmus maximus TaxID=52904 RepID=A0A8D3A5D2_SCOMX|nr:E3 ubiquitin-protein ligase TTC3 [Scophthalmus maximus]XP_035480630.1 E3 ubiquitin-protein ligase TTC3 [Scophthalmus maximus]